MLHLIALLSLIIIGYPHGLSQEKSIQHLEPSFWWVGMQNPELQVLVHGEDVSKYQPTVDYKGITLQRVIRVDNPNYLFLYFVIRPDTKPGKFQISFKRSTENATEAQFNYPYELKSRREGSHDRSGFSPSDVIYLITPDRFVNGDPTNDELPSMPDKLNRQDPFGRHGGDIEGIIRNLDYIHDMGFTAIWLNPVVENNMDRASYHGYATTNYYKIDPRFGSNEDYQRLSREAGKRGIKLIMDQIMNHCGSNHWWMKDMPTTDWINSNGAYKQTSHKRVTLHDPYAAQSDIDAFTNGWFVRTMPDLNQENPLLADYLIQNSIWWVEFADLGGIRHDTHPYAGKEFMADYSCRIMNEYPNFNIVGEEWSTNPAVIAKWQRGKENPDHFVSCMPSMFDFPLQTSLIQSLTEEENWSSGWVKVYEMLSLDFLYADPLNLVIFPDNHDMDRIFTQVNENYELFKMDIVYNLTMRGIPQIYYGTEILMTNAIKGNHGLIRADFPGGWEGDKVDAFNGNNLGEREADAQKFMKDLLNWRKTSEVIHMGRLMHYAPIHGLYVFFRYLNDQKVMVMLNKSETAANLFPDRYPEMLHGTEMCRDVLSGKTYSIEKVIVPPYGCIVLEIK